MFTFQLLPRLAETDGVGHIHNTHFTVWFEEGRRDLLRLFNPSLTLKKWNLILKRYEIEIHSQTAHDIPVTIRTGITAIGKSSFTIRQHAFQEKVHVASAVTVSIHFDYNTNRPVSIPAAIREKLEQHRVAQDWNGSE